MAYILWGYLSCNTLVIFVLRQSILRIIRYIGNRYLYVFPIETDLVYAFVASLLTICVLIPVIAIYNNKIKKLFKI